MNCVNAKLLGDGTVSVQVSQLLGNAHLPTTMSLGERPLQHLQQLATGNTSEVVMVQRIEGGQRSDRKT